MYMYIHIYIHTKTYKSRFVSHGALNRVCPQDLLMNILMHVPAFDGRIPVPTIVKSPWGRPLWSGKQVNPPFLINSSTTPNQDNKSLRYLAREMCIPGGGASPCRQSSSPRGAARSGPASRLRSSLPPPLP